jgi:hypothetical protein
MKVNELTECEYCNIQLKENSVLSLLWNKTEIVHAFMNIIII